jgi:hypothetical protein
VTQQVVGLCSRSAASQWVSEGPCAHEMASLSQYLYGVLGGWVIVSVLRCPSSHSPSKSRRCAVLLCTQPSLPCPPH